MPSCMLCRRTVDALAESHVYPKALHLKFGGPDVPPFVISRNPSHPAKTVQRSPTGIYGTFVCHPCEHDLFGPADNAFMELHHRLAAYPQPDDPLSMIVQLVPGDPDLLHRFALQTFWRWAVCPTAGQAHEDYGPVLERVRAWLMDPSGTLRTDWHVAVSYRVSVEAGFAVPPGGGWRAGSVVMTIGNFTFFIAARSRGLRGSLGENRLQTEGGVRLLVTTQMHDWIIEPIAEILRDGRNELVRDFVEHRRQRAKKPGR